MNNPNGVCLWHGHCTHTHTGDRHGRRSRPGMMPLALTSRFGLIGGALAGIVLSGAAAGQTPTPQCLNDEQVLGSDTVDKDYFGSGVAIDGRYAIVGAVLHDIEPDFEEAGAAYIFERDGDDWSEIQKIQADPADLDAENWFGEGVDISGDVAIVSSPGLNDSLGGVYVFRRNPSEPVGDQWEQETVLTASDGTDEDGFGGVPTAHEAVAIDTNLIVVGAAGATVGEDTVGKVYAFLDDGQQWNEDAIITAGQFVQVGAEFGLSVAISGRRIIIGAPGEDLVEGAAYVFKRDNVTGQWDLEARLTAPQPVASGEFGRSVSIDGARVIVGEPGADRAHVFAFVDSTWTHVTDLEGSAALSGDKFGYSVAISGSLAVVGSWLHDHPEEVPTTGAAYVFQHQPEGWTEVLQLYSAEGYAAPADRFGEVVTIHSDQALIAALGDEPPTCEEFGQPSTNCQHGTVYFFPAVPGCAFD